MRRLLLALSLVAAAAITAPLPASSERTPTSGLRARAQQVLAQVDALDRQIEQVAEAYDYAGVDLAQTRRSLRVNAQELRLAQRNLRRAQATLARRLVVIYEQPEEARSTLAIVLGATDLSDLIDRLDAAQQIAEQDKRIVAQVQSSRTTVLAEGRRLRREQTEEQAQRQALRQRRTEIEGRLAQRRRLLDSIRGEVARLQAQERTQQQRLRREAEARLAAATASRNPATPVVAVGASASAPPESTPDPPSAPPAETSGDTTASAPIGGPPPTRHAHVVPILMRYLGTPYQWGGASPSTGFDCSGLVLYVYAQVGVSLPHNAALQYAYGTPVDRNDLEPGDLVFFNQLGHDGVYIGGDQFIDAPKTGDVVKIENLDDPWWAASYVGARRLP